MNYRQYIVLIKGRMGDKRFNHSIEVSKAAVRLARKYGADEEKAQIAGILHDVCKETSKSEQLKIFEKNDIMLSNVELNAFKLWHAISGAAYIKSELEIDDPDIVNAVRYHTTARKGMSLLEKVIYIADYISDDRDYDGVDEMRKAAKENLDDAMTVALQYSICELAEAKKCIHPDTVGAYNEIMLKNKR